MLALYCDHNFFSAHLYISILILLEIDSYKVYMVYLRVGPPSSIPKSKKKENGKTKNGQAKEGVNL